MTVRGEIATQAPADAAPGISHAERRRIGLGAIIVLAGASSLILLNDVHAGPALHWIASLVALAGAIGVLVIAHLRWQRALADAETDGLVARSRRRQRGVTRK
jgi:hypothetical protein